MLRLIMILISSCLLSCAHILQVKNSSDLNKIEGYEKKISIKQLPEAEAEKLEKKEKPAALKQPVSKTAQEKSHKQAKPRIKKRKHKAARAKKPARRLPKMEDSDGFDGRRPIEDPFRVGESTTLALSYFNIVAGEMEIKVLPFVEVNGKKSYHFQVDVHSNSFFSHIYSVKDQADTYVSFEDLIPFNLAITLKESKQLAETRTFFDWKKNHATYWQKKFDENEKETKKELSWDVKPFSQNVVSAGYYLRTFQLKPGKKLAFRVADAGKNIKFTGEVLRREVLKTDIGQFKTVVVKPKIEVDGVFKQVGDILIWLTDDDRKFIVRAESKIKIGTIVGKLRALNPGPGETIESKIAPATDD